MQEYGKSSLQSVYFYGKMNLAERFRSYCSKALGNGGEWRERGLWHFFGRFVYKKL